MPAEQRVAVVDFGLCNLRSVLNRLRRLRTEAVVARTPADVLAADRLILPGVGHFAAGMRNLERSGLIPALRRRVLDEGAPILGICLGMQLFTGHSEEGDCAGLGWIDARTRRFQPDPARPRLKYPHMGWNSLAVRQPDPLLEHIRPDSLFYFVHSYFVDCANPDVVLATTTYGTEFVSVVRQGNVWGTQFHPEKSHSAGFELLRRFLAGSTAAAV